MKSRIICASLLVSLAAAGQAAEKIAFEVASIKPSEPQPMGKIRIQMSADNGMLRYSYVSLKDCIRNAYRVKDFQVQGPDWLGSARFDIVAKFPEGATQEQVPEMLQALLAERFKLTLHRETKDHAIYALVAGKGGPKLKPADVQTPAPGNEGAPSAPKGGLGGPPRGNMMMQVDQTGAHLKAPSATLAGLAEMMSRFSERPVVDMSGIEGQYDFDLVFSPETLRNMKMMAGGGMPPPGSGDHAASDVPSDPAGSLADSVQRYGLKLDPRKAAMEVLIVDHIEKTPTEN